MTLAEVTFHKRTKMNRGMLASQLFEDFQPSTTVIPIG